MTDVSRRDILKAMAVAPFAAQAGDIEILGARVSAVTTRVSVVPRGQRDIRGDGSLLERAWPKAAVDAEALGLSIDPRTGAFTFPIA
ncbi:MAG TPA: hypothetical protein VKH42_10385, partial [Vicinamibacterales bacterium]|nr:hypothetical protein [Vicinamibacterales bacterium]